MKDSKWSITKRATVPCRLHLRSYSHREEMQWFRSGFGEERTGVYRPAVSRQLCCSSKVKPVSLIDDGIENFFEGRVLCDLWTRKDKAGRAWNFWVNGSRFSSGIELGREGTVLWKGHMQRRSEFGRGRGGKKTLKKCEWVCEREIKIKNR